MGNFEVKNCGKSSTSTTVTTTAAANGSSGSRGSDGVDSSCSSPRMLPVLQEGQDHSDRTTTINSLHGNLMRSQHHQNPMKYYHVCTVLGEGSMGSVAKVKKRVSAKGGSARPEFVKRQQGCCFRILSFLRLPGGYSENKTKFVDVNDSDIYPSSSASSSIRSNPAASHGLVLSRPSSSRNMSRPESPITIPETGDYESDDVVGSMRSVDSAMFSRRGSGGRGVSPSLIGGRRSRGTLSPAVGNPKRFRLQHSSSTLITYGTKKESYYALKSILLDRCYNEEFKEELRNEVEILKSLDHPNIVRAIETFDYHNRLSIVLELCNGGDLYTRDPYTEQDACRIIESVFKAVAYLHSKGIVHRDLKFENIMFVDESPHAEVKIIDFGLSQKFAADEHLHDAVGTVYTMAPELIGGDYGPKVDVWSLGVIAFMLLSSSMPFYGKDRVHVIKKILRGKYTFSSRRWKYVSDGGKEFVKDMLRRDPDKRPTAEVACQHRWFDRDLNTRASAVLDLEKLDDIHATIQAFAEYETLKKLALMVVAYKSTSEEIGFLRKTFSKIDVNNDGEISLDEFKEALSENYEYTDEEMESLFRGIDVDGTGTVHYIEFLAATIESHGSLDEERLAEAFDRIDSDDSGTITVGDLKEFLGDDIPEAYLERVIAEADFDNDHTIDYEEFLSLWNAETDEHRRQAREDVGSRRVSRRNSLVSSASSDDLTETESVALSDSNTLTSSGELVTASHCFEKQKQVSVRKGSSLTQSQIDRVLKEKGVLPPTNSMRKDAGIHQLAEESALKGPNILYEDLEPLDEVGGNWV